MTLSDFDSASDVIDYLEVKKDCFFRGQSPENRMLNCTLARELCKETKYLPPNYIPIEPLSKWTVFQFFMLILI